MGRTGTSKLDWVHAGQQLLIEGGITAVKLHDLTARLELSSGSFYHHFKNFDDYLTALADYYGTEEAQQLFTDAQRHVGNDPELLLREATTLFGSRAGRQLNIAMRFWANNDNRASAAIRRYDEVLTANLMGIFVQLGFDEMEAKSRTLIMLSIASLDIDPTLLNMELKDLWRFIRDNMLLPQARAIDSAVNNSA